jgi:hypothetical protein
MDAQTRLGIIQNIETASRFLASRFGSV